MENLSSEEDFDLSTIPGKALNVSRMFLSIFLNPEQPLPSTNGYARDFRGLAQQMDFDYMHIRNFQRHNDPTSQVLEAWECQANSTIGELISMLKKMDRHDVIEDCLEKFKIDARSHCRRNQTRSEIPIQVPEVTSYSSVDAFQGENPDALTIQDMLSGGCTHYDAYVCYAEEDSCFVSELAKYLESEGVGLTLFIKGRDQLCGIRETDLYVKLIEERCSKMLIILTPDFLKSRECEFQASYAAGLAIEQRRRKIIPIFLKNCKIPSILKYLSKIDFTRPDIHNWLWDKLIISIRGPPTTIFITPEDSSMLMSNMSPPPAIEQHPPSLPAIEHHSPSLPLAVEHRPPSLLSGNEDQSPSSQPVITFPPTQSYQLQSGSTHSALVYTSAAHSAIAIPSTSQNLMTVSVTVPKTTPPAKQKWFQNIKGKFTSLNSSPASMSSAASSATSGFYSQSGVAFESGEIPENETSM